MRKVLIGCGIVAALFVVVLIVGGVVVSSWVKSKFPDTDRIESRQAEMRERFGDPDRFTPPLDGGIPRDRLEIFVALRDSLTAPRDSAAAGLARFVRETKRDRPQDRGRLGKISDAIGMAQGGADMVSGILSYFGRLQEMMLDAGMGDGEYAYWYCLTALSWLEWDPLASPDLDQVLHDIDMQGDAAELRGQLLRTYRRQLGNLRRDLAAKAGPFRGGGAGAAACGGRARRRPTGELRAVRRGLPGRLGCRARTLP